MCSKVGAFGGERATEEGEIVDRFTWGVAIAVVALSVIAVASVAVARQQARPPDLGTAGGVVTAYIGAIQDKQVDEAWDLLASPEAAGIGPPSGTTREAFRQQVTSVPRQGNKRIRIVDSQPSGDTARVDVEITTITSGPVWFGPGSYSRTVTFSLKRERESWRITAAPSVWELG